MRVFRQGCVIDFAQGFKFGLGLKRLESGVEVGECFFFEAGFESNIFFDLKKELFGGVIFCDCGEAGILV